MSFQPFYVGKIVALIAFLLSIMAGWMGKITGVEEMLFCLVAAAVVLL
jgi:hypothetical protein